MPGRRKVTATATGGTEWKPAPGEHVPSDRRGVHPLAWERALELAGGDARRIEICDARTVRVVNLD